MFLLADEQWKCRRICTCAVDGIEHLWSFGLINKDFNVPPCSVKVFISIVLRMVKADCMCPAFSMSETYIARQCLKDPTAIPPHHFRNSLSFYRKIIPRSGRYLQYGGWNVQNDRDLVYQAVHKCPAMFQFAGSQFIDNLELATIAVKHDPNLFRHVGKGLRNDVEFVKNNVWCFRDPADYPTCWEARTSPISSTIMLYGGPAIRDDFELVRYAILENPFYFSNISPRLRDDPELAFLAVMFHTPLLEHVSERLRSDVEFVKRLLKLKPSGFGEFLCFIKCNKEIALIAVKQYGCDLEYLPAKFKSDFDVCMAAVKQNGTAIRYTASRDPKISLAAVKQNGLAIKYISVYDRNIALAAVQQNGMAFNELPNRFKNDLGLARAAVKQNPAAYEYVPKNLAVTKPVVVEPEGPQVPAPDPAEESSWRGYGSWHDYY